MILFNYPYILEVLSQAIEEMNARSGYKKMAKAYKIIFKRLINNNCTLDDVKLIKIVCYSAYKPKEYPYKFAKYLYREIRTLEHETRKKYRNTPRFQ